MLFFVINNKFICKLNITLDKVINRNIKQYWNEPVEVLPAEISYGYMIQRWDRKPLAQSVEANTV